MDRAAACPVDAGWMRRKGWEKGPGAGVGNVSTDFLTRARLLRGRFAGWGRLNPSGYFSVGSIVPDRVVIVRNRRADLPCFDAEDGHADARGGR